MNNVRKVLFSSLFILQACQFSNPSPVPSSSMQPSSIPIEITPSAIQSQAATPSIMPSNDSKSVNGVFPSETLIKVDFKNFSADNVYVLLNNKGYGFLFKGIYAKYVENFKFTGDEESFTNNYSSTYMTGALNDEGNGLIAWDTGFSGVCSASNVLAKQIVNYTFSSKEYVLAEHVCLPYPKVKLDSKGTGEVQWDKNDEGNKTVTKYIKKINKFIPSVLDPEKAEPIPSDNALEITKPIKVVNSSGNGYVLTTGSKVITLKPIRNNIVDTQEQILYQYKNYGSPASISMNEVGDGMIVWSDYLSEASNNPANLKEQVFARLIKSNKVL